MDENVTTLIEQIEETANYLIPKIKTNPEVGIILGTGLGALADDIEKDLEISYQDIPHFPISTVEFHEGKLIFGKLGGKPVMAMQGRFHYYEGYTMRQITFPVRVMKRLGIETLLVSNACGGINSAMKPGDLMIITDHINLFGDNPLIGENDNTLGPRFPDMSEPYNRELIALAESVAADESINVHKGVYAAVAGPNLETAAEYRFLRTIGADVVGMSTVPENIVAVHSGMRVLGISVITDACVPEQLQPANIAEIIKTSKRAEPHLSRIMENVVSKL